MSVRKEVYRNYEGIVKIKETGKEEKIKMHIIYSVFVLKLHLSVLAQLCLLSTA